MDIFGKKKIKQQQEEIDSLKNQLNVTRDIVIKLNEANCKLKQIFDKVIPTPVITKVYTIDAIEFAKSLQRFQKRKSCGQGRCGMKYEIPCDIIDSTASNKQEEVK